MTRCYSKLKKLKTFEERFEYLKLVGTVGESTFGYDRYLNQFLYHSDDWSRIRNQVILRDNGCDLGIEGHELYNHIIIHHMNPLTKEMIVNRAPEVMDPEFLISTSINTHNAIHYGTKNPPKMPVERKANDMCPWLL